VGGEVVDVDGSEAAVEGCEVDFEVGHAGFGMAQLVSRKDNCGGAAVDQDHMSIGNSKVKTVLTSLCQDKKEQPLEPLPTDINATSLLSSTRP